MKFLSRKTNLWNYNRRPSSKLRLTLLFACLTAILLSACGEQVSRIEPDYFIAPTLMEKAEPIPLKTSTPVPPSATPECENSLSYLDDLTILDGSIFSPNDPIDKVWQVVNSGTCNWDNRYKIRFVSGELMGVEVEQALFPARSSVEAEIRIVFTAPQEGGRYKSAWQAVSPGDEVFGDIIFLDIFVDPNITPEVTLAPTSTATSVVTPVSEED